MSKGASMTLRFLGAGGAFSRRFGTTCSLLTLGEDERWLIDCGRQAPDQLEAAGLTWHHIRGQIITHVHGDHTYGLEDFAFQRYYVGLAGVLPVFKGGPRPHLISHTGVTGEIWEQLAPSLRYLKKGDEAQAGTLADYFEIAAPHAVEPPRENRWNHAESFAVDALRVLTRENLHVPGKPSVTLEFELPGGSGRTAWWSGDSTVEADVIESLLDRATVLFHDCTFVEYPGQVHGSFALLEALSERARKKIVLMHHEDDLERNKAKAEALGFRIAMPGEVYDLHTGQRVT